MAELRLRGISRVLMTLDPVSSNSAMPRTKPSHAKACIQLPWDLLDYRLCSLLRSLLRAARQAQTELALAGPAHPAADQQAQLRPVLAQPLRVEEAGHIVPAPLTDHDAVQLEPGLLAWRRRTPG